jgi:hypothetical protein
MRKLCCCLLILISVGPLKAQVARRIGDDQPLQKSVQELPSAERNLIDKALQPEIAHWLNRGGLPEGQSEEEVNDDVLSIQKGLRYERRGDLIFVQAYNLDGCGAVGNCQFFLLNTKYQILLSNVVALYLTVLKASHNGLPDVLLGEHISASQTALTWYRFNGLKYGPIHCGIDTYGMPYKNTKRHRGFGPCKK